MNLGNAVYGLIAAAGLWWIAMFFCIFIFVWPITQEIAVFLLAWLLGLGITIGLKMILTMACHTVQYRAFYRIRPRSARMSALALECWFIGLVCVLIEGSRNRALQLVSHSHNLSLHANIYLGRWCVGMF